MNLRSGKSTVVFIVFAWSVVESIRRIKILTYTHLFILILVVRSHIPEFGRTRLRERIVFSVTSYICKISSDTSDISKRAL